MKHPQEMEKGKRNFTKACTVEEALTITSFGKYNYYLLMVCSWTLQAMGLDLFGTSFVVTAAVCDLKLTMQQRAMLTATPFIGVVLGAQVWGYVSDTKGRKFTLVLSMAVGFMFSALSSLSPDWRTMIAMKLLSSTFTSASNSAAYTLLGESCAARGRSRVLLLGTCALMCSQGVTAIFLYPILPLDFSYHIPLLGITYSPWRLLALVLSLPCAATSSLLLLFHESPKFLIGRGKEEEALKVLQKIYEFNTGDKASNFPVGALLKDKEDEATTHKGNFPSVLWQQTAPIFRRPMILNTLLLFYIVIIVYMTGSGFIMWLPYIMNNLFSVLESGAGQGMNLCAMINKYHEFSAVSNSSINETITEVCVDTIQETTILSAIIYGAIATISNLILSLTCGSRKRVAMLFIIATSMSAGVLINLVKVPIAGAIFFFVFMLCALCMGILSVYFIELYPTSLRGTASCLSVMLGRSSAFVGVNLIGPLLSNNCESTFYFWSCLLLSAFIMAWFLPKDKNLEK